jgi:hypothetical protein
MDSLVLRHPIICTEFNVRSFNSVRTILFFLYVDIFALLLFFLKIDVIAWFAEMDRCYSAGELNNINIFSVGATVLSSRTYLQLSHCAALSLNFSFSNSVILELYFQLGNCALQAMTARLFAFQQDFIHEERINIFKSIVLSLSDYR